MKISDLYGKFVKHDGIIYILLFLAIISAFAAGLNFDKLQNWTVKAYSTSIQNKKDIIQNHTETTITNIQVAKNTSIIQQNAAQTNIQIAKNATQTHKDQDVTIEELRKTKLAISKLEGEMVILQAEVSRKKRPLL
jgi:hypothetical protein